MMLDTQRPPRVAAELIDSAAIVADLKALAETHAGRERELRAAVARRLKTALIKARARAEELLRSDRLGRRCAERLCQAEDEIIRIVFEFVVGAPEFLRRGRGLESFPRAVCGLPVRLDHHQVRDVFLE